MQSSMKFSENAVFWPRQVGVKKLQNLKKTPPTRSGEFFFQIVCFSISLPNSNTSS